MLHRLEELDMQRHLDCQPLTSYSSGRKFFSSRAIVAALVLCACTPIVLAQSKKLGTYKGVIQVSESLDTPNYRFSYRATVKVSLPVSSRDDNDVSAEFLAGEAPVGSMLVSQAETFTKDRSADSGGQFNTVTCSLAAPVEIPITPSGVLNVDLKKKKYSLSISTIATKEIKANCVHSRSGPFKGTVMVPGVLGTGAPGEQSANPMPFTDPSRLSGKFTLAPGPDRQGTGGPIVQEWALVLEP